MIETSGFLKLSERDNYNNGFDGYTATQWIDYSIRAKTMAEFKQKVMDFLGVDADAMECDACDEIGRIDIQRMENDDGDEPHESEWQAFRNGEIDLWAVTYTCTAEEITRRAISADI